MHNTRDIGFLIDSKPFNIFICDKFINENPDINPIPHKQVYTDVKFIIGTIQDFSFINYDKFINQDKFIHGTFLHVEIRLVQVKQYLTSLDEIKLNYLP